MKTIQSIISILLFLVLQSVSTAQTGELEYRDGYYYKNGMLYTGTHVSHYEGGAVEMEMTIRNGLLDGITRVYHPNGIQKEQRFYAEGLMDSLWINWNENSIKLGEARYKKGIKDGYWYIWDENGVKRYEMFYRDGRKAGKWFMWDEKGNLISEKDYDAPSEE